MSAVRVSVIDYAKEAHIKQQSGHPWASAAVPCELLCWGNLDSHILERLAFRFERQSQPPVLVRIARSAVRFCLTYQDPPVQRDSNAVDHCIDVTGVTYSCIFWFGGGAPPLPYLEL